MIGVLPLQAGSSVFQTMFSPVSRLQAVGRFLESLTPLPVGPRHCGQFSLAASGRVHKIAIEAAAKAERVGAISKCPFFHSAIILAGTKLDPGILGSKLFGIKPGAGLLPAVVREDQHHPS